MKSHGPATLIKPIAVLFFVLVALTTMGASPAFAAQYWSEGSIGSATIPNGVCRDRPVWNRLDLSIPPPAIYARDAHNGAGNDSEPVRYRVFVVDANGNDVKASGYSGFGVASDNAPAKFTGPTVFEGVPQGSRLDVRIEWWNSTSQVGALAFRVDTYSHYRGDGTGPYGGMDSCARW